MPLPIEAFSPGYLLWYTGMRAISSAVSTFDTRFAGSNPAFANALATISSAVPLAPSLNAEDPGNGGAAITVVFAGGVEE